MSPSFNNSAKIDLSTTHARATSLKLSNSRCQIGLGGKRRPACLQKIRCEQRRLAKSERAWRVWALRLGLGARRLRPLG